MQWQVEARTTDKQKKNATRKAHNVSIEISERESSHNEKERQAHRQLFNFPPNVIHYCPRSNITTVGQD